MENDACMAWPQIASWTIDASDARFMGHFPGHVVVPGAWLLDHAVHQIELTFGIQIDVLRSAKFTQTATPGTLVALMAERRGGEIRFAVADAHNAKVLCCGVVAGEVSHADD